MKLLDIFKRGYIFLMIAIAIIVLVATVLKPRGDDLDYAETPQAREEAAANNRRAGGIAMCAVPIIATIALMFSAARQQRKIAARIDRDRFLENPALRGQTPDGAQPVLDILTARGFTRVSEVAMYMPASEDPAPAPFLIRSDKKVTAYVAVTGKPPKPAVVFETTFTDGFILVTNYPTGLITARPHFRTTSQSTSVEAALDQHISHLPELEQTHGPIHPIASLNDRTAWWTAFGALHKAEMQRISNPVLWLLTPLILMIISAIGWFTSLFPDPVGPWIGWGGLLLLIGWLAWNIKTGMLTINRR